MGKVSAAFRVKGVRFWILGAGFGLLYQIPTLINVWSSGLSFASRIYGTVLLVIVYVVFLALPPILWAASRATKWWAIAGYTALTLALAPVLQVQIVWIWILVVAVAAVVFESPREFFPLLLVFLLAMQVLIFVARAEPFLYVCILVTASLGMVMHIMNRQLATLRSLRAANAEIARLAVVEERARFSRDLHDVLGHTLTVVAVKSELATKLVDRKPASAKSELDDIERLSRDALSDLRAAVSNYREVSLEAELVSADRALAAAGIRATLPQTAVVVPEPTSAFFVWVLREGVTNVIRHSHARNCVVEVDETHISVTNDTGPVASATHTIMTSESTDDGAQPKHVGNGIRGLRERAEALGATVTVGPTETGFRLEASLPHD